MNSYRMHGGLCKPYHFYILYFILIILIFLNLKYYNTGTIIFKPASATLIRLDI